MKICKKSRYLGKIAAGMFMLAGALALSVSFAACSGDDGNESIEMVTAQAGTFSMGSPLGETGRYTDEPQHSVTLSKSFRIAKYPVTQELYESVTGKVPSSFTNTSTTGEDWTLRPVETVSWYDALVFCNKLSVRDGFNPVYTISGSTSLGDAPTSDNAAWNAVTADWNANGYRLPTEAEWEYACRAGTTTAYFTGNDISSMTGWYTDNSSSMTHEVGLKNANAWGLYDMAGNVLEWCWDWYGEYPTEAVSDPKGPATGTNRVLRGGAYNSDASYLRSAFRFTQTGIGPSSKGSSRGFRVVRNYEEREIAPH